MNHTSQKMRALLAGLAVVIGLFLVAVEPLLVQTSLERVLASLLEVAQDKPQFGSGIMLFSLFYPFWRAMGFVAGTTLLVIAVEIYRGKAWTLPVALIAYAIPAISGMFMFLPYVSWVEGFPLPMTISWAGLLGFWSMLLLRQTDRMQKLVDFLTFTFIGMLATHAFTLGIGALRMLITRPGKPLFEGPAWWILTMVGEINWLGVILLMGSIPLLALRKPAGWWLAVIGSTAILLVDAPTQLIRTATLDYLYGTLLAVGALLFLLLPAFKQRLIGTETPGLAAGPGNPERAPKIASGTA